MNEKFALLDELLAFGARHIALGDVDPIYTMVRNSTLDHRMRCRFIFSHLMVYDLKYSIPLADTQDDRQYYDLLTSLFREERVGKDRKDVASRESNPKSRSFGTQIPKMRALPPEVWVENALQETRNKKSWRASLDASKRIPTFGEYFGFKLADMIETVFDTPGYRVSVDDEFISSMPRGAITGFELVRTGSTTRNRDKGVVRADPDLRLLFETVAEHFRGVACPQNPTREIGAQEVETLLCDYRKMRKGTLAYGDKVYKLHTGIAANADLETAKSLLVGAQPMIDLRQKLLSEVGISNINLEHTMKIEVSNA